MRIAVSCAGEGLGHAARLAALAPALQKRNEVYFFVPPHLDGFLREKIPGFHGIPLPHFSFVKVGDSVHWGRTARAVLPSLLQFPRNVHTLSKKLKELRIQCIISDFDPYLAWAGKVSGIPVFQMNHPGIIGRKFPYDPRSLIPSLVCWFLEGPWSERVHVSFFYGDVGPLFRPNLFTHPVRDEGFLLLSLKPSYREPVLRILSELSPIPYRVFPQPGSNFEDALAGCTGIISSAGHQIIAEAIRLGKPILVLPQQGQWEQTVNASMLEKTGRGMKSTLRNLKKDLPRFLTFVSNPSCQELSPLPTGFTVEDGTEKLIKRLEVFFKTIDNVSCQIGVKPSLYSRRFL
ncbi:MAG: hypothetical protein KA771_06235 [Spirochaetales bacterium]|nr:hypothetical protein [Spirochaetales bacterium]